MLGALSVKRATSSKSVLEVLQNTGSPSFSSKSRNIAKKRSQDVKRKLQALEEKPLLTLGHPIFTSSKSRTCDLALAAQVEASASTISKDMPKEGYIKGECPLHCNQVQNTFQCYSKLCMRQWLFQVCLLGLMSSSSSMGQKETTVPQILPVSVEHHLAIASICLPLFT